MTVVPFRPAPPVVSQYDRYPLPFFNAAACCTWAIKPTGDYAADCATGHRYGLAFLQTCDGTYGWGTMLGQIVADMIRAGTSGTFADGRPKVNGVVIGFMRVISEAAMVGCMTTNRMA